MSQIYDLTDFYSYSTACSYLQDPKLSKSKAVFEVFFRRCPFDGEFAIVHGITETIKNIEEFLQQHDYINEVLRSIHSDCMLPRELCYVKINYVEDGSLVFPREPIITIEGPLPTVQLLEAVVLNTLAYRISVATKAHRIYRVANGRTLIDFGLRRAPTAEASTAAALASFIGGFNGTSNIRASKEYSLPLYGTMPHSFVQAFGNSYDAFKQYIQTLPPNAQFAIFLIDTYSIEEGLDAAIRVIKEDILDAGRPIQYGIRIDSGDLASLANKAYKKLAAEGLRRALIVVSNELDEYVIAAVLQQTQIIDSFGVGTKLVNVDPVGVVYKLCRVDDRPVAKLSDNTAKATLPYEKVILRFKNDDDEQYIFDLVVSKETWSQLESAEIDTATIESLLPVYILPELKAVRKLKLPENYSIEVVNSPSVTINALHSSSIEREDCLATRRFALKYASKFDPAIFRYANPARYPVYFEKKLVEHLLD